MNKTEIIRKIAKEQGRSKREVLLVINSFIEEMKNSLVKGDRVTLSGFGSFSLSERKGFDGVDPRTGEPITIPNRRIATFKCSKSFKEDLNGDEK